MGSSSRFKQAMARFLMRAQASPFSKPVARGGLAGAGLVLFAVIGHVAAAGPAPSPALTNLSVHPAPPDPTSQPSSAAADRSIATTVISQPPPNGGEPSAMSTSQPPVSRSPATPEDPVVLNSAGVDDLRRLPGIGEKRAAAILSLRERLGRFRAVED